jgi:cell division protein FtsI (penicillin-binding protein 3)
MSMIVMVDEPVGAHHGGDVAAPVFKRVAEQVLRYMSVPPDVPMYAPQYKIQQQKPLQPEKPLRQRESRVMLVPAAFTTSEIDPPQIGDVTIPDFQGKSLRQVTEECLKAGLRLQSAGSGAAVEQLPPAGVNVRAGARIQVRFSSRVGGK